jgi:signal transduction histidine kinase/ligand-binding sensor domain-containing protein/CheY-like chemotaxis protein
MYRFCAIFICLVLLTAASPAEAGSSHRFRSLRIEDGLSQSIVADCFQDSRGFLWAATEDGLNRYDGYEFKVFRHDPVDRNSLIYNYVSRIGEDNIGGLWIGTHGQGLDCFDYRGQQFTHFLHDPADSTTISDNDVLAIAKAADGSMWVGTSNGLNHLDPRSGRFRRYVWPVATADGGNDIRAIAPAPDGKLWLGTGGDGVALFDPADGSRRRLGAPDDKPGSQVVISLMVRDGRELWLGTEHGLHILDLASGAFRASPVLRTLTFDLAAAEVRALAEDKRGDCWIGTTAGLVQVERLSEACTLVVSDRFQSTSLPDAEISSLLIDRSHVLWVGSRLGLSGLDLESKPFEGYSSNPMNKNSLSSDYVRSFLEDDDGGVWIATFSGLDYWHRQDRTFTRHRLPTAGPQDLGSNRIYVLTRAAAGRIWVGTGNGAYLFDPAAGDFRRQGRDPGLPGELGSDVVRTIIIDRRGDTWFGTDSGLDRLVAGTGTVEHFSHDPDRPAASLCNDLIYTMAEDYDGELWIGTINGLSILALDRYTFRNLHPDASDPGSLSSQEVLALLPEPAGTVWVGTPQGLNRYDHRTGRFTQISSRQELPNDTIYAIVADDSGRLWLSTNDGLARLDPRTGEVRAYDHDDGLQSDEFNLGAGVRLRSGELAFGGIRGFNVFDPAAVRDNTLVPELVFTEFKVFNRPVAIGPDAPLKSHISTAPEITLSHRDYVFSFEFAALHFAVPKKNRYATMLEGVDKDWIDIGTRHMVAYNNLPPGDYIFRVKAANCDGTWNEKGIAVNLKITPPFWQRAWFRGVAFLALAGAIMLVVGLRTRSIARRTAELEQKVAERTAALERANLAKSEFLANMSHEIRTPLNCVIGVADLMNDLDPTPEQKNYLGLISQSGTNLLSLINDILDLSKVEADQLQLEPLRCDLPGLCTEVLGPLAALAGAKDLDLVFHCDPATPRWVVCDSLRLRQVLVNLVNNAIKFTDAGEIRLDVSGRAGGQGHGRFSFRIMDTGLGIEPGMQQVLFEKFTQADASTTRRYGGTGLGLAISKRLVELMGGRLEVESRLGEGATFHFTLDLPSDGVSVADSPLPAGADTMPSPRKAVARNLALKVLLAEDNAINQTVARHLLEHMGCRVDLACTGFEAVAMSANGDYDVVLMDCQMPEMDGYEATRRIRAREGGGTRLAIVALTANAMAGDRVKCLDAGMDGYLAKPVVRESLADTLRALVGDRCPVSRA